MRRRNFLLGSIGLGVGGSIVLGTQTVRADHEDHGSITLQDQSTDGSSLVIDRIETDIDATLGVRNIDTDADLYFSDIGQGEYDDYDVDLPEPLSESAELSANLYDQDGHGFARDTAFVEVSGSTERVAGISPTLMDANPDAGFNYPYFLYAPSRPISGDAGPIMVEPNNTGETTDDFEKHKAAARRTIENRGISRQTADELGAPFLVPVFPRPRDEPVDWTHYVHQLDDDTMEIEEGPLERVDLQLLRMIDHAQAFIKDRDYPVDESGIMLNGFSASGNFVDRFAVLHPEEVISVTAGGLNGMALLPLEELDGRRLPYHVGIANVEELIGHQPDLKALSDTNQFLFMGAEDSNDTIPFDDAWTDEELRQLALEVYGEDMIAERFPRCQEAYRTAGVAAQFRIYPDAGHTPHPAEEDIKEFHRRSVAGEAVTDLGQNIVPQVQFTVSPSDPTVNHKVEFDAGGTDPAQKEILSYAWDFDDNETETGETVTHSFSVAGTYEIQLQVIFEDGSQRAVSKTLAVSAGQNGVPEVDFTISPSEPTLEEEVQFDAGETAPADKEIRVLAWDFGDGETETGVTASHSFAEAGTYDIQLTVTFADGSQKSTVRELTVTGPTETDTPQPDEEANEDAETASATTDVSQPGFGVASALAGIGAGAYLLNRCGETEDDVE